MDQGGPEGPGARLPPWVDLDWFLNFADVDDLGWWPSESDS